jgi:hypothetical protein
MKDINVYFFLATDSFANGTGIDPVSYTGGVYFQVKMSNQVYDVNALTVSLTDLRPGDQRLVGDFSSSATMITSYKGTYAYLHANSTDSCTTREQKIVRVALELILSRHLKVDLLP